MKKTGIDGVHRVTKRLGCGRKKEYHYAFRGGPQFWTSDADFSPDDPRYAVALTDALRGTSVKVFDRVSGSTAQYLNKYRDSATFALNSGACCLRFDISDLLLVEDQQTANRSLCQCPNFGG